MLTKTLTSGLTLSLTHAKLDPMNKPEPDFGAVIMFCHEYASGRVGTIVAIREQDTGQWKSTSNLTRWRPRVEISSRTGVSWGVMQDIFPAIKNGHWVRMTAEDREFSCS